MPSAVIKAPANQLTLDFEPGLVERYGSLRECIATGVYQRGLKRVAIDLDQAPSNLSVQLSEDPSRHFSVDSLERYIDATGDKTPVLYLIEKYFADQNAKQDAAQAELMNMLAALPGLMKRAGVKP
jgi:hypothetical protein